MQKALPYTLLFLILLCPATFAAGAIPEQWRREWESPSAEMRPLQIIHGGFVNHTTPEGMSYFKDKCGLGGIVTNLGSKNYLYDEEQWAAFVNAVRSARQVGLRVWIYDEDGYPSPEAGGVVLRGHPELECIALVYDKEKADPFSVRPAYEYTHAANNYAAARRYPNLLDAKATARFLEVTHQQYRDRLGKELFDQVEAFFTDEPSMNAINIGQIPEEARKNVRVDDPIDPDLKPLPMVPWVADLPEKYREKYGEDLLPLRKSLFEGETEKDKSVRKNFWSLLGDLNARRYYGAIQDWCKAAGSSVPTPEQPNIPLRLAASGHSLHEEPTVAHPALDGNKIEILCRLDVPGLDVLNSDPRAVFWGGWRAAVYPCTAAELTDRRLVMTEISDFSQIMDGKGPVPLEAMCAASAWQAAWGVTEFTLYYGIQGRGEETHKKYCEFIGRLNAILRAAKPVREVSLYYPITELQEEYLPQADPLSLDKQTKRMQETVKTFEHLGQELVRKQIPFVLSDDKNSVPAGKILVEKNLEPLASVKLPAIEPKSGWIALGRFERDSRDIFLLMNADEKTYEGKLAVPLRGKHRTWSTLDPANGEIATAASDATDTADSISIRLEPKQTLLFVGE